MRIPSLTSGRQVKESFSFLTRAGVFLALFFCFLLIGYHQAQAAVTMPTTTSTSAVAINSIRYNWVMAAGDTGSSWLVGKSTDGITFDETAITPTTTVLYNFTSLATNTAYWFRVASTDGAGATSSYATSSPVYTLAEAVGAPTIGTATSSTRLPITINTNSNPAATTYAIYNATDGAYIAANGTANGATPVYQTTVAWGSISAAGLSPNAAYQFSIVARNGGGTATASSTASAPGVYTLAAQAGVPIISSPATSSLTIGFNDTTTNSNPASTTYAIFDATTGAYLKADGTSNGATPVYQNSTTWSGITASGLSLNTAYQFAVVARNANDLPSASSTASVAQYTLANVPGTPTVSTPTSSTRLLVTINTNSNPAATTYAIYNVTDGVYLAANGTANGATPVYQVTSSWANIPAAGLSPNAAYQFAVVASNGTSTATASSTASAAGVYTLAAQAGVVTVGTPTTSTLPLSFNDTTTNGNPASTTYAIFNATNGVYLNASGVATSTLVYQNSTTWSGVSAVGLSLNTAYQFAVVARNANDLPSASSTASVAQYTLAAVPSAPTFGSVTSTTRLPITINVNSNPAATTYAIYNATDDRYLDSTGAATTSAVYRTNTAWGSISAAGLSANTAYQFSVIAKNGTSTATAASTASAAKYTATAAPYTLSATADSTSQFTFTWNGSPSATYYAQNSAAGQNSGWISATSTTFTGLTCGGTYTLEVKARNGNTLETALVSLSATTLNQCGGGGGGGGGSYYVAPSTPTVTTPVVTTPVVTPTVTVITPTVGDTSVTTLNAAAIVVPQDADALVGALNLERDAAKETQYQTKIASSLKEFKLAATADQKTAMTNFVTYGASNATIKLGSGERLAVIRDYADTVQRAEINWADIERITNGEKPVDRNLTRERSQVTKVLALFKKVVGHTPNFQNSAEDLAWNTMMYRIRFDRDLTKEAQAAAVFKKKIGRAASTPVDWATVRAIAYAL